MQSDQALLNTLESNLPAANLAYPLGLRTERLVREENNMQPSFTIRGVIPPILTPFTAGGATVDEAALRAHVQWLVERGVHGVMPCGTTGEGPLLSTAERRRVLEVVIEAAAGRLPVVAHVGAAATQETIDLARHAQACGAAAISVVTPYYFRLPDSALIEHFCRVAEAVPDAAIFLYNIPQNTGNLLTSEAAAAIIARCSNVIGIKDSAGDLAALTRFISLDGGKFQVVCGSDKLLLDALIAGAGASVSGNANVFPEVVVGIFEAFWRGDIDAARRQQLLLDQSRTAFMDGRSISLFKRVLERRGLHGGSVRPPLPEATPEMLASAIDALHAAGLLS
jgi:4-hydroxy-tetrahydrodipicolinate synthase